MFLSRSLSSSVQNVEAAQIWLNLLGSWARLRDGFVLWVDGSQFQIDDSSIHSFWCDLSFMLLSIIRSTSCP
jgi:hypothetical protein